MTKLTKNHQFLEGSQAIAKAVEACKPQVISAYPITPQTHIVEHLAKMKADGELGAEYVYAESEFAAASIVLGASAAGSRAYTATTSQGLLLMTEVLYCIGGMQLPLVITVASRAVSGPLNIWNDQQDIVTMRDAGWIQLFAETIQEAVDLHFVAYKITEQTNIPVMINVDGFLLTHTAEPVVIPDADLVKKYLPPFEPKVKLDIENPKTFGAFADPSRYQFIRQKFHDDIVKSEKVVRECLSEFGELTGRGDGSLTEGYELEDAETVFVSMGSVIGTIKDSVDELRKEGKKVGILKIKSLRPFPTEEALTQLKNAKKIAVIDKSISLGTEGIFATELKAHCYGKLDAKIQSFVTGLGGKDITHSDLVKIHKEIQGESRKITFV